MLERAPTIQRGIASHPLQAAIAGGLVMLLVYAATLAPGLTFWDAGEFIAAARGLGIPHPPGTPLYVLIARAWSMLLAPLPTALAVNVLSAVATAGSVALMAGMLARWVRSRAAGVAGALVAGSMASVWRNATEAEVYALALLLAVTTIFVADLAARPRAGLRARAPVLVAYLLALAVPLHPFALVAAPGALVLASLDQRARLQWPTALLLGGAFLVASGAAMVSPLVLAGGAAALVAAGWLVAGERRRVLLAAAVMIVALTAVLVLLVRARHDPPLNQGDPSTWSALVDHVARRQYAVAPLWPRQAPLWLQLGTVLGYADWQVAAALAPAPGVSWRRASFTVLFLLFGAAGSLAHRARDRRSWLAMLALLVAGSIGAALQLNLKAGPSVAAPLLRADAPREPRERDYFFVFAFWAWGAWAGVGAVELARRAGRPMVGLPLAMLPIALNWRAVDRSRGPDATLPRDVAVAYLAHVPQNAVLLSAGDNDTYPLWYLQQVEGVRTDVTVVATGLLPANWYRAELRRRDTLGTTLPLAWPGMGRTIAGIAAESRARDRPVMASPLLAPTLRRAAGDAWTLRGVLYERADDSQLARPAGVSGDAPGSAPTIDRAGAARASVGVAAQVGDGWTFAVSPDPAARVMRRTLACAPLAAAADTGGGPVATAAPGSSRSAAALLATWCNWR